MAVKIFYVQGNKLIGELESEINKWQKSLGPKASVTHMSTAMTEHEELRTPLLEARRRPCNRSRRAEFLVAQALLPAGQ